ncbi:MAG: glycosyltransferase family 4 protein [Nitrososphaerales archaeon]|nr:glycosyltransferase family 4 protein [Nitrososphaerales archaeon]
MRILVLDALWKERDVDETKEILLGGLVLHTKVLNHLNRKALVIGITSKESYFKHIVSLKTSQPNLKPLRLAYYVYLLKLIATAIKATIVYHPHTVYNPGFGHQNAFVALILRLLRLKVITYFHHWATPRGRVIYLTTLRGVKEFYKDLRKSKKAPFFSLIDCFIDFLQLKTSVFILTGTKFGVKQLREMGVYRPVFKTGIGVDASEFKEDSNLEVTKKYDGVFVGRMSVEKGIFDLLHIWRTVVNKMPEARLAVVGLRVEPYYKDWKLLIEELQLQNNVQYLGPLPRKELLKVLRRSKVFVFPSKVEGAGIAVAEAMASSLPVVAYPLDALCELYGQSAGFKPCKDIREFAETICKLLESNEDRRRLGDTNREYVIKRYVWDKVAEQICSVIENVANK